MDHTDHVKLKSFPSTNFQQYFPSIKDFLIEWKMSFYKYLFTPKLFKEYGDITSIAVSTIVGKLIVQTTWKSIP